MNRRGFLGRLAATLPVGVFGLPEVKAAPGPFEMEPTETVKGIAIKSGTIYDNPICPEAWAEYSLKILQENLVISNLVRRDFDDKYVCKDRVRI